MADQESNEIDLEVAIKLTDEQLGIAKDIVAEKGGDFNDLRLIVSVATLLAVNYHGHRIWIGS